MKNTLFSFVSVIAMLSAGTALAGPGAYDNGYDPYLPNSGYGAGVPNQYEAPSSHANKSAYEQMMQRVEGRDADVAAQRQPQAQPQYPQHYQQQRPYGNNPYGNAGYNQYGSGYNQYGNGAYEEERRYDGNKVAYEQMMQSTQTRNHYTDSAEQQYHAEHAETEEPKNVMQRGRSVFQSNNAPSQPDYGRYGR